MRLLNLVLLIVCTISLSACADKLMVPGGDRQVNEHIFENKQDLMNRVGATQAGMSQPLVFSNFNVEEKDLIKISREEIMQSLFGDNRVPMSEIGTDSPVILRNFLRELYGYKLRYQNLERKHGIKDVIRYRTKEEGFDYEVTFIFHDGVLFEKPILTGGAVKNASSITIFDGIRYGTFIPGL